MKHILSIMLLLWAATSIAQLPLKIQVKPSSTFIYDISIGGLQGLNGGETIVLKKLLSDKVTWVATYMGKPGTIDESYLVQTPNYVSTKSKTLPMLNGEAKRMALVKLYGSTYGNDIYRGRIRQGMNKAMVIELLGEASDINKTVGIGYINEQWVYEGSKNTYYYFQNGKLTGWQD